MVPWRSRLPGGDPRTSTGVNPESRETPRILTPPSLIENEFGVAAGLDSNLDWRSQSPLLILVI